VLEPERRNTFPAIAFACAYLSLEKKTADDETVVVLPCDPYTEVGFFRILNTLDRLISADAADIALIGIKPTLPTSKYGYIVPATEMETGVYNVSHFVEKPSEDIAAQLIEKGAYWNGGVFAFKLGRILGLAKADVQFTDFTDLNSKYNELEKTSFDYKVVEKAKRIAVVPYHGKWTDIGTWRTLADEMPISTLGAVTQENTKNTFIVNELNIPLIALGAKDLVIAASPDGILVSDMVESSQVKPLVDKLENMRPMYEECRWGEYTVLSENEHCLVKNLFLTKGKSISNQAHKSCDEIWNIVHGEGKFTLDGDTRSVTAGDVLKIKRGQKSEIEAVTDLYFVEVQLGGDKSTINTENH
jgi:mannose-1-phosphate guanylyltransferase